MKKRSKKRRKRTLATFTVRIINRLTDDLKVFRCLRVEKTDDHIVVVSKDRDGLINKKLLPRKLWVLEDEDEPDAQDGGTEPGRAVLSAVEDEDDFFELEDGEPAPERVFTPPVRTSRPLGIDETAPGEYNARDPKNWEKPSERVNLASHVNNNVAQEEGRRMVSVYQNRQKLLKRAEISGAGFTYDRPTGG